MRPFFDKLELTNEQIEAIKKKVNAFNDNEQ